MGVKILFIIISFIIGGIVVAYIRSYDIHEKEPFYKMVIVMLWGGVWSVIVSFFLYSLLYNKGINVYDIQDAFGAILVVGPVEEGAKLLALFMAYYFIKKELNALLTRRTMRAQT